jgi:hypothetical protein
VQGEDLEGHLKAWEDAGLLSDSQAARIRDFETAARAQPVAAAEIGPDTEGRRARLSEIVGYVGSAFAVGAIALLLEQIWERFEPWARLTLVLLLAVTALAAGAASLRRPGLPMRRLTAVLWLAGVAAVAWAAAIVGTGWTALSDERLALLIGLVIVLVAGVLLSIGRLAVLQLATLVGVLIVITAAIALLSPLPPIPLTFGLLLIGGGAAWALAGAGGWLGPGRTAELAGSILALIGSQVLATGSQRVAGLVVGLVVAGLVVAASLVGDRSHLLFVGAAGLFVIVPRLVFELFADTLGAPATLLAVGILLILLATGLGRVRTARVRATDRTPAVPSGDHGSEGHTHG